MALSKSTTGELNEKTRELNQTMDFPVYGINHYVVSVWRKKESQKSISLAAMWTVCTVQGCLELCENPIESDLLNYFFIFCFHLYINNEQNMFANMKHLLCNI